MPYLIVNRDGQFCVVKANDRSRVFGCHPSRKQALAQLRAIYANEKKR